MDYLISVSHSDFMRYRGNLEKVAEICSISGFPGIEGYYSLFEGLGNSELEDAGETLRESGVKTPSFHLPCHLSEELDLINPKKSNREKAVRIYKDWIEKASIIGFKKAIVHGTTYVSNTEETELGILLDRFSPSFEELLKCARKFGVTLALENQNPSVPGRFTSKAEHLYEVKKRFESPFFGFCLDFGHAYIEYGNSFNELYDVVKDCTAAVHVHSNHGKEDIHLPPGYGGTDWALVKNYLKRLNLPLICVESSPHPSLDKFFPSDWKKLYIETCEVLGH